MPRILIYDIETELLKGYLFSCGDQVIRHGQLVKGHSVVHIICISYMFKEDKVAKTITWDPVKDPDQRKLIEKFDAIVEQADFILGKNNKRFDDKHVNTHRMMADLNPLPYWSRITDDVEKQLRRYFKAPSMSLDYWSQQIGLGGKAKMEFTDWIHIKEYFDTLRWIGGGLSPAGVKVICPIEFDKKYSQVLKDGKTALKKMEEYNKKDVTDTKALMIKIEPYVNFNYHSHDRLSFCLKCNKETDTIKHGTTEHGKRGNGHRYQKWTCQVCKRYKFETPVLKDGKPGVRKY